MIISRVEALALLQPYLDIIGQCITDGWNVYREKYIEVAPEHSPTTRPGIIRDHIVARVRRAFDGNSDLKIIEKKNGLFCLVINQIIAIRFKKLDRRMITSNSRTRQARTFIEQLVLPGFPPDCTYVNAGYIPDELWAGIKGIYITCHNRSRGFEWTIQLPEGSFGMTANIVPFEPVDKPSRTNRVRVKKNIEKDTKDGLTN